MYRLDHLLFYAKRLHKEVNENDLSGAAAELSYRFFLSLFPLVIFLAALGSFAADLFDVQNPTDEIMDLLGDSLPSDTAGVLRTQIDEIVGSHDSTLLSIGIVGAIWSASSGIGTVMKRMNRAYKVRETRPFWKRYLMSVGLTVLGGAFVVGSLVLLFAGQVVGLEYAGDLGLADEVARVFALARWPVAIAMLLTATAFLYWAAPNVQLPFRWITPGAVLFVAGWLLMSYLFAQYVSNFGSYNVTYGALAGIVVLLVWFYLTAFLLLLGAEINVLLAQELAPEELPQTAAEGATPETVPSHRREEARDGSRGVQVASVSRPRLPVAPRADSRGAANPIAVAILTVLLVAISFWRPSSRSRD